jgi:hypothetical protein
MDIISQFKAPVTLSPEKHLLIPTEQKVVSTLEQRNNLALPGIRAPSSSVVRAVPSHCTHYDVLNYSNYLSPHCFNSLFSPAGVVS